PAPSIFQKPILIPKNSRIWSPTYTKLMARPSRRDVILTKRYPRRPALTVQRMANTVDSNDFNGLALSRRIWARQTQDVDDVSSFPAASRARIFRDARAVRHGTHSLVLAMSGLNRSCWARQRKPPRGYL